MVSRLSGVRRAHVQAVSVKKSEKWRNTMADDSYTEVSSRSWFSRIGGAFTGIVIGLVMMAVAFGLLFWNEGRAVGRYKTLQEGGGMVRSVAVDKVDSGNEGRLVHVAGRVNTAATLADHELGVQTPAIGLIRDVEMYQWKESKRSETKKKFGGGEETVTTYSYTKEWERKVNDSGNFKKPDGHGNPSRMAYESRTTWADDVRLGGFRLPDFLVRKIGNETSLALGPDTRSPQNVQGKIHRQADGFYLGADPTSPQVGDLRIRYRVILPADVSLVARQAGSSFESYKTSAGGTIELLEMGIHAADTMFQKAQQTNTYMTWGLRAGGFLLMVIGANLVLGPLAVFADVVPAIGSLIGAGTKLIASLLAGVLSFLTIGIAWFVYRPLIGIGFAVIAGALFVVIFRKMRKAGPAVPPPLAPPPVPGA